MKKIKYFALAVMAMLSTNAFAQVTLASDGFKFAEVDGLKVEITQFANDYAFASDGIVVIPATLTNTSGDPYQVIGIADNAFDELVGEPRLKVKGVKIAASVTYIGEDAFADFGNLASVEFGTASAPSKLAFIKDGAFADNPMLKSISFANCPSLLYFTDNGKATDDATDPGNYTTPFWNGADDNDKLTTITLNEGTLDFGIALAHLKALTTQNIKNTRIVLLAGGALEGTVKIETLELPETKVYKTTDGTLDYTKAPALLADALDGSAIKTLIVNGKVFAGGVDELGIPTGADTKPSLTSVTFKGDIEAGAIMADAFKGNTNLKTVTFEGELEAEAVEDGAFTNAGDDVTPATGSTIRLTVTALKAVDDAFGEEAFSASDDGEFVLVKVNRDFDDTAVENDVNNVKWEVAAAPASKIFLESNDNTTYYAKFFAAAKTSISKGEGDVVVYEAYADGSNIYMDPLYSINDKYVVALGQAVIIKVKGTSSLIKEADGKKYIECEGAADDAVVTQRYLTGSLLANKLDYEEHETNQEINKNADATKGEAVYAVAKISTNGLKFKPISNEGTFYLNDCVFIVAKKSAAGVRVIWLDEEATAIKNVKAAKAENGAIYNLAGQKVNAAYKGVVIKDGKKYIQK